MHKHKHPVQAKAAFHLAGWKQPYLLSADEQRRSKYEYLLALTEDPRGDLWEVQAWAQAQLDELPAT